MNAQLMKEVLKPQSRAPGQASRNIQPATFAIGSLQDTLLSDAAEEVRSIYSAGTRRVQYDARAPEPFYDAKFDTARTALEVDDCIADSRVASIASAIFKRAGFHQTDLQATTLRAQVEIQIAAVTAAERIRWLFAEQQALAV